jgi:hypothetical protein
VEDFMGVAVSVLAVVEDSTEAEAADSLLHQARKKTGAPPSPRFLRLRWEAIRLISNVLAVALNLETLKL